MATIHELLLGKVDELAGVDLVGALNRGDRCERPARPAGPLISDSGHRALSDPVDPLWQREVGVVREERVNAVAVMHCEVCVEAKPARAELVVGQVRERAQAELQQQEHRCSVADSCRKHVITRCMGEVGRAEAAPKRDCVLECIGSMLHCKGERNACVM